MKPTTKNDNQALAGVIGYKIRKAHHLLNQQWAKSAAERGISQTPVEAGILMLIAANPDISQSRLAKLLGIEAPTLSQALTPLLKQEFVARKVSVDDRRRSQLLLTPKGMEARQAVAELIEFRQNNPPGTMTREEGYQLSRLLDKLLT